MVPVSRTHAASRLAKIPYDEFAQSFIDAFNCKDPAADESIIYVYLQRVTPQTMREAFAETERDLQRLCEKRSRGNSPTVDEILEYVDHGLIREIVTGYHNKITKTFFKILMDEEFMVSNQNVIKNALFELIEGILREAPDYLLWNTISNCGDFEIPDDVLARFEKAHPLERTGQVFTVIEQINALNADIAARLFLKRFQSGESLPAPISGALVARIDATTVKNAMSEALRLLRKAMRQSPDDDWLVNNTCRALIKEIVTGEREDLMRAFFDIVTHPPGNIPKGSSVSNNYASFVSSVNDLLEGVSNDVLQSVINNCGDFQIRKDILLKYVQSVPFTPIQAEDLLKSEQVLDEKIIFELATHTHKRVKNALLNCPRLPRDWREIVSGDLARDAAPPTRVPGSTYAGILRTIS